ncbi:hypothetical protein LCGC14_0727140 [marine sediment metagenome]|uniref:Right handed beta helix domain-containing protein n=1 Tax=marine sediment metagenome TaxID=412755 RepID=A0A0F9QEV0_9ZZZZ
MSLDDLKTEIAAHPDYKDLDQSGWEAKIEVRAAHLKYDGDLQHAIDCYVRKIPLLREMALDPRVKLKNPDDSLRTVAEILFDKGRARMKLETKIDSVIEKCACCLKEQELRKDGLVTRSPHNTDYYIDYVNGSDANTGVSIAQHWKTITKYTKDTVRSAGDRAFLRANTTWAQGTEAVDIAFDEDGTLDAYIELIGADSVINDPWSDSSDVKPIIDFEDGVFNLNASADDFWRLQRLDLRQSADTFGAINILLANNIYVKDCNVQDGASSLVEGATVATALRTTLDGCSFLDTGGPGIDGGTCDIIIKDCTITAGVGAGTTTGLFVDDGTIVYMRDTTFSGSFGNNDLSVRRSSIVYARNVTFSASGIEVIESGQLFSEDDDGTFEDHITTFEVGVITRDTGTVRGGGANSSAKMEPTSLCGPNRPLILGSNPLRGFRPIWVTAGSYTATVYVRVGTAWDSALTAAECYMKTSELDNAGNATRVERQSTETINNAGSWTALTTSISPARDGFVYFWVYLAEFEDASEHIFVDILPTVA